MFIPLLEADRDRARNPHVALETVTEFYRVPPENDRYCVVSSGKERRITKKTYELLKSLVLRP